MGGRFYGNTQTDEVSFTITLIVGEGCNHPFFLLKEDMEKDILKSILCDKLEKAVSHKYVRKEPDGKAVSDTYIPKRKENRQTRSLTEAVTGP